MSCSDTSTCLGAPLIEYGSARVSGRGRRGRHISLGGVRIDAALERSSEGHCAQALGMGYAQEEMVSLGKRLSFKMIRLRLGPVQPRPDR
jgi:hypothetical protein